MKGNLNLWDLTRQLTITRLKLRHEGTFLGFFWYLLNPLFTFIILYSIFSRYVGKDIAYYPFYLIIGIVQWNFMNLSVVESIRGILDNHFLIKSVKFRYETLPVSVVLMSSLNYLIEIGLLLVLLIIFRVPFSVYMLFFPLLLALQMLFILGIVFALSSLVIYFRDICNIWNLFSFLWWFATPIFYSEGLFYSLNQFNPMYHFVTLMRGILIYNIIEVNSMVVAVILSFVSFTFGYLIFSLIKRRFAELV